MQNEIVTQIADLAVTSVNVPLIIVLMAIGYVLKHVIKNLDNSFIPIILGIVAIAILIGINIPFNAQTQLLGLLVEAIVNAVFATVFHDQGKTFIENIVNRKNNNTVQ